MEVAKVTSKGQITVPISIRRKLEINEGDKVLFIYKPEGVMMVNPNTLQGGNAGVVDAAETEMASEAIEAMKARGSAKGAPKAAAKVAAKEPDIEETVAEEAVIAEPAVQEPVQEAAPRPVPPPVEAPPPPDKHVGGLNLGTLLDDIRSIGSNI